MSLQKKVTTKSSYTRSVNIKRDSESETVLTGYIPTTRAILTLKRFFSTLHSGVAPRAWSLVGPYGSGKSAFALFLSQLLGSPGHSNQQLACKILRKSNKTLAAKLTENIIGTNGYLKVLISGTSEPLAKHFASHLFTGAQTYWKELGKKPPAVLKDLNKITQDDHPAVSNLIGLVHQLQKAVYRVNGRGIVILIDELGKFLEYETRHTENNDIFLLQALAEQAYSGGKSNVFIFTILHQAFDQYAKGLGKATKEEWSKIQGRFETISFLETSEQVLRVLGEAISQYFTNEEKDIIHSQVHKVVNTLLEQNALSGSLENKTAIQLFSKCYPIHPITLLLLPLLCQKISQNERTLFSYLGSPETHAFHHSLGELPGVGSWILPWAIYDYFIMNQSSAIFDHVTHRRWSEVMAALDRLGDAPVEEVNILKTIGLLNIIGPQGGFKASEEIIGLCYPEKEVVSGTLTALQEKSIIQYRKFNREFRVWQGTDFDMEVALEEELSQLGKLELTSILNTHAPLTPVVGRKHSIKTGALRYFTPLFTDSFTYKTIPKKSKTPRIVFFLSETEDEKELFSSVITTYFSLSDVLVLCENSTQIRVAVAEVVALKKIEATKKELHSDPIAQFALKDRLHSALSTERTLINSLIASPENNFWIWRNKPLHIKKRRGLQNELSKILDVIYKKSPILKNELINKNRPSSQAVAARNKLLLAMYSNPEKEDLGIEKYPAEKGIYKALFKATGIHREVQGKWHLSKPCTENDPCNIAPVWECIEKFLEKSADMPMSFTSLAEELTAPPYGVKEGVLPILYMLTILMYQHELAIYENDTYIPFLTKEHIDIISRRPETFKVQLFRIQGVRASLFNEYSKTLNNKAASEEHTVLSIVRPLAKFMAGLPEYTKNTKRLSKRAGEVKAAFIMSKSPQKLLFTALPAACGFKEINNNAEEEPTYDGFSKVLLETFKELNTFYKKQLEHLSSLFCGAFFNKEITLAELRTSLRVRLKGLEQYSLDRRNDGLRAFILRIADEELTDEAWFEDILSFLGRKPINKWSDIERDTVEYRLTEYVHRMKDLERLHNFYKKNKAHDNSDFEVILLRAMRHGKTENDEVVYIDKKSEELIKGTKKEINDKLEELPENKLRLALLADLIDEFLEKSAAKDNKEISVLKKGRIANE